MQHQSSHTQISKPRSVAHAREKRVYGQQTVGLDKRVCESLDRRAGDIRKTTQTGAGPFIPTVPGMGLRAGMSRKQGLRLRPAG